MRKSALTFTFFALALVAGSRALPTVSFLSGCECGVRVLALLHQP